MLLRKGLLIALEGIDGSGKTTLAKSTKERLEKQGLSVVIFKEPTDQTEAGKKIRQSYHDKRPSPQKELEWFIEDREWDVTNRILPALAQKKIVFLDRYYYSTACYQGIRMKNDWEKILKINRERFPEPDLTIIIDVPPKIALSRISSNRHYQTSFEKLSELDKIRKLFLKIYEEDKQGNFKLLDGKQELQKLEEELFEIITELVSCSLIKQDREI